MDRTAHTERGRHWELRARVASGFLFAAALVGLSLPWEPVESRDEILAIRPGRQTGLDMLVNRVLQSEWSDVVFVAMAVFLVVAPVIGLTLSFRGTRRAAVVRAILAFVSVTPFAFLLLISFGLTGRSPDIVAGWVTFWALAGAFVVNVIASLAATGPIAGKAGPKSRTPLGVGGS